MKKVPDILTLEEIKKEDIPSVGGKGASLGEMFSIGLPVPRAFVVTAQAFRRFLGETGIEERLFSGLANLNVEDNAALEDASGKARDIALAYAKGIGATRAVVLETSFREETETDLFGEQAVLCGGCTSLIKAGFETLVDAGYAPEMAYLEILHELKLIVDLIHEGGLTKMRAAISNTAQYGDLTRGPRVIGPEVYGVMQDLLEEIQTGEFAKEWILENQVNRPVFNALTKADEEHLIEEVGKDLRSLMPQFRK